VWPAIILITELARVWFEFETPDLDLDLYLSQILNLELTLERSNKMEIAQYIGAATVGLTVKNTNVISFNYCVTCNDFVSFTGPKRLSAN
jgi:hypothetical protein